MYTNESSHALNTVTEGNDNSNTRSENQHEIYIINVLAQRDTDRYNEHRQRNLDDLNPNNQEITIADLKSEVIVEYVGDHLPNGN